MMQENALDEMDCKIIDALQIHPRASWSELAPILETSESTLSRRWDRLSESGIAYVTGIPGPALHPSIALVEIRCAPRDILDLGRRLSTERAVASIDLTAGGREMLVTVGFRSLSDLGDWLTDGFRDYPEVTASHTHVLSGILVDAHLWRMRALTSRQADLIRGLVEVPEGPSSFADVAEDSGLIALLARLNHDGRMPLSKLSEACGIPVRRLRRLLPRLEADGRLVLRTDVARPYTPWPVLAWYFLRVPATQLARMQGMFAALDEVRMAAAALGPANVILSVWLRDLGDVQRFEITLGMRIPGVIVEDRSVVFRSLKHLGRLLWPDGRRGATVEMVPPEA
ncbi:Lrp/AsnC family transcriptional regulator [uncultured Bifidobacterium sp.]|uniref:Lrp/AsnC family transcriptional regulator n=1 Tax=uncultured Bifidobacterium sp. TaxID=165187 RepID=UPI0028DD3754|nr:Lrp/AsnC family transcriptional regulator [uncultured Bifidobacterium sp.]